MHRPPALLLPRAAAPSLTHFSHGICQANTWRSLLKDQYEATAADFESMEKKMTLERFARENPGFDFSKADISGNFQGGGPNM